MIPGLDLRPSWLNPSEQSSMMELIASLFRPLKSRGIKNDRSRILRYGWTYESSRTAIPRKLEMWPLWLEGLRRRLPHECSPSTCAITINEYAPGYRIGPHIDSEMVNEHIQSLSLGAPGRMRFTHSREDPHELSLLSGDLLSIGGESRHDWLHEILPVQGLRYSVIFRDYRAVPTSP